MRHAALEEQNELGLSFKAQCECSVRFEEHRRETWVHAKALIQHSSLCYWRGRSSREEKSSDSLVPAHGPSQRLIPLQIHELLSHGF